MKKNKKAPEEGGSWMDTYGDLVTLLLCFFVLLYSISSIDQAKWVQIVKSFNPNATEPNQIAVDPEADANDEVPGGVEDGIDPEDFDGLFEKLQAAVKEAGIESEVELFKGEGYTFITFRDSVFFDGDSSVIKSDGTNILDAFSKIISDVTDSIKEIEVLGHTSQADPDKPNNPETDRVLAAERAARVVAYVQEHSGIEPEKILSTGYGQWKPIAPFDTPENRAKNRRVEILITRSDSVEQSLEEYYKQMNRTSEQ